jgi:hypothetical protein
MLKAVNLKLIGLPGAAAPREEPANVGFTIDVFLCAEIVVESQVNKSWSRLWQWSVLSGRWASRSWLVLPLSCQRKKYKCRDDRYEGGPEHRGCFDGQPEILSWSK